MKINRQQILESMIDSIHQFANKEYQYRVWIRGEGPEVDDFDDAVCNFLPLVNDIVKNVVEYKITDQQRVILIKFRDEFDRFCDDNDYPEEFIDSPRMGRDHRPCTRCFKSF